MNAPHILYEDNHILVVRKQANQPCAPDSSGDPDLLSILKADIKERYQKPGAVYLGLVHRLDRPVEGLMVYARTSKAAARLSEQIRTHQLFRVYYAVLVRENGSIPLEREGILRDRLEKNSASNTSYVVTAGGKEAELQYSILAERDSLILVKIRLKTGRSHQIRVQFSSRGYPLFGDARYGHGKPGMQLALFSGAVCFRHPTKQETCFFTDLPPARYPFLQFSDEIRNSQRTLLQELNL